MKGQGVAEFRNEMHYALEMNSYGIHAIRAKPVIHRRLMPPLVA